MTQYSVPLEPSRTAVLSRARELARALTRHGLGYLAVQLGLARFLPFHLGVLGHPRQSEPYTRADHLRSAFEELGTTFIKLGQVLSIRPDLLPADAADELAKLQERALMVPWEEVQGTLERELGERLAHFAHLEPAPLAAASIGQVHRGGLWSGEQVAVKVQRPDVVRQVERDLAVLRRAARRPAFACYDPVALVEEFARTILAELDYARERRNLERYAKNLGEDAGCGCRRCTLTSPPGRC